MSEFWKLYEGQVIDNRFRLRSFLGGTDDSAVFLIQFPNTQSTKAAIKFIPAGPAADQQLSLWRRAKLLSHPNLIKIVETGRCRLENRDRLFVVMEYAEEDLAQILPERPLSESEARDMLGPVLDALVYLHSNGLAHSRLKPSNILATTDKLKLSSDSLLPIGETRKVSGKFDPHDAPEIASSPVTAAADVWSLGITLVETLTQQVPAVQPGGQADAPVPDDLRQPFLDVARHALRREPRRRWTVAEIAARLNPVAVAAAAAHAGVSPLAVPLSPVAAVPAAKLSVPRQEAPPPRPAPAPAPVRAPSESAKSRGQTLVLPNYVVGVAAGLFVLLSIVALPRILGHRSDSSSAASTAEGAPGVAPAKSAEVTPPADKTPAPKAQTTVAKAEPVKPVPEKRVSATAATAPSPTPASVRTDTVAPVRAADSGAPSGAKGEVLDQVLPAASDKALATIHGVVRVSVRVHVDPSGNVSGAELDSAGPSQYFADLALQAARKWQFNSPEVAGHSVPSEWLIRFHFTPAGPTAIPSQVNP